MTPPPRRSRWRTIVEVVFGVVAVVLMAVVVIVNWNSFRDALTALSWGAVVASVAAITAATLANVESWRRVLAMLGTRISPRQAGEIMLVSQIGKYIPGGVWPIVAGSARGARAGISPGRTALSLAMQLAISLAVGGILSLGAVLFLPALADSWWIVIPVALVGVTVLAPPVLRRLLALAARLLRWSEPVEIDSMQLLAATAWSLAAWALFGLSLWSLVAEQVHGDPRVMLLCLVGYAVSWVVGFLAVLVPAGAGVREGILVLLMTGILGAVQVTALALVSRIAMIAVDGALFFIALLSSRRRDDVRASR
ncbi:MAG: lysylphosphatidylglycerol synthase domain-containing protein [Protaetiibacter sp.]